MWRYLFALLALQSAFAAPISPCEQLKLDIVQMTDTVTREVLTQFAKLLQQVVDDASQIDVTDSQRIELDKMVKLIEISNHMEDLSVHEIIEEVEMLFDLEEESDESDGLIEELLDKHGYAALEEHLGELFHNYFKQFENHIEIYFIRNELKQATSPMEIWLTKFTNEQSMESKASIAKEIFDHLEC